MQTLKIKSFVLCNQMVPGSEPCEFHDCVAQVTRTLTGAEDGQFRATVAIAKNRTELKNEEWITSADFWTNTTDHGELLDEFLLRADGNEFATIRDVAR